MITNMSREVAESKTAQMNKKSYNRFQWWRRYAPRPELDERYATLQTRILHGDFEVSDYFYQAAHEVYLMEDVISETKDPDKAHDMRSLYMERFRRLTDDFEKEEKEILRVFKRDMRKSFGITQEQLEAEMEEFDGDMNEFYLYIKNKYSK